MIDFSYFSISKIIDFHGTVVIFELFAISTRDVSFVLFLCHFGAQNRPKWYPKSSKIGPKMVPKIDTRKFIHFQPQNGSPEKSAQDLPGPGAAR